MPGTPAGETAPRPIDHLALAVPDLAVASALYRTLGFTVGPENRHPWGTVNAIVRLDGAYLELISLAPEYVEPASDDPAHLFAISVAGAVARGGGMAMLAFGSEDADADAALFAAAGLGSGRRLDFSRSAASADGTPRTLRFSLAFLDAPSMGEARLFTCCHHQPFGDGAAPRHSNGATGLDSVALEVESVDRWMPVLETVTGAAPRGPSDRPSFATATGRVDLVGDSGGGLLRGRAPDGCFRSYAVAVEKLERVRAILRHAGVVYEEAPDRLTIPASSCYGVVLAFVAGPCHAMA